MTRTSSTDYPALPPSDAEKRKRRREVALAILSVVLIAALTYAETRVIRFGAGIPVSNTILMFIIINVNLLLLILVFFLVVRNLVKLIYERRRKVMGSSLRAKLVLAFMGLSLVPTVAIFFFSLQFMANSMEFWFNVPVEQSLEQSLSVGRRLYDHVETNHRFFAERIAYQIRARNLLAPESKKALCHYIEVTQRAFNLNAVDVYSDNATPLCRAQDPELTDEPMPDVTADKLFAEAAKDNPVRTFTTHTPHGELVRTVSTVPFGQPRMEATGYVVVTTVLPPELSGELAAIRRGFEEYQQIKLLKEPIAASHLLTLSIVALVILFFAVWFGLYLAKSFTVPIAELAEGTRRVAGGDLSFTLSAVSDDEMGSLVTAFNKMTRDLRTSRQQLELSARQLAEQNVEIEKRRRYTEVVLNNVSTGVISLDSASRVTTVNKSAEKMLGISGQDVKDQPYRDLLSGEHLDMVSELLSNVVYGSSESAEWSVKIPVGERTKSFMVHATALRDEDGRYLGMVVAFDDQTELERAQRLAAWREVARRIAHEVKNPLTPIKLSAQRLARKFGPAIEDPVFTECTDIIIDQVDLIRNLVNEFSTYARFPVPEPVPCDLVSLVSETLVPYREGYPNADIVLETDPRMPRLLLDPHQIKRAVINLVDNAVFAIDGKGTITVSIRHDPASGKVSLSVADTGPGIDDDQKARLFEPYFSTKKAGMGLGLAIVSTIVSDHDGTIRVEDNAGHGAVFIIEWPVPAPA